MLQKIIAINQDDIAEFEDAACSLIRLAKGDSMIALQKALAYASGQFVATRVDKDSAEYDETKKVDYVDECLPEQETK